MAAPALLWGTCRVNGRGYVGRVHIVRPGHQHTGWCGLPVDAVWPRRLPPRHDAWPAICPECSINYLANTYAADPAPCAETDTLPALDDQRTTSPGGH